MSKSEAQQALQRRQTLEEALRQPMLKQTARFVFDSIPAFAGANAALVASTGVAKFAEALANLGSGGLAVPPACVALAILGYLQNKRPNNDLTTTATILGVAATLERTSLHNTIAELPVVLGLMAFSYVKVEGALDKQQKTLLAAYKARGEALQRIVDGSDDSQDLPRD